MVPCQKILLVEIIGCSIDSNGLAIAPRLRQLQLQIEFDKLSSCGVELIGGHVALIDKGKGMRADFPIHVPCGLIGAEIAAECEDREQVSLHGLIQLRIRA